MTGWGRWSRRRRAAVVAAALVGVLAAVAASPPGQAAVRHLFALRDGAAGYLYGYPLVTMTVAERALSAPPTSVNAFTHTRFLPRAGELGIVRPSRDVLYSSAWLDLRQGPLVVHTPDMGERFWLMPILDAWTNVVASPGSRTTGNRASDVLVAGPSWQGMAPAGVTVVRSPTDLAWVVGRIEVRGPEDVPAVARLQDGFAVTPLARWPDGPANPAHVAAAGTDAAGSVRSTVDGQDARAFFTGLAEALATERTLPQDGPALAGLARIGIVPGEPFEYAALPAPVRAGLQDAVERVQRGMTDAAASGQGATVSGPWRIPPAILGRYGHAFEVRAVVAREGLGANLPEDAIYATASTDSSGAPLQGGAHYVVRFASAPPVRAFWSLTGYDEGGSLVAGVGGAPSVSSWDHPITSPGVGPRVDVGAPGPDGAPHLGTSGGRISLVLRLYWPQEPLLAGTWAYPTIERVP